MTPFRAAPNDRPAPRSDTAHPAVTALRPRPGGPTPLGDVPAHILVVDDEADVRATFAGYLRLRGFTVSEAESGTALRRTLAAAPVDLVLLDLRMPGEDGLSIARSLRESADVGIIILTALDGTTDRVIGLEVGADDYVGKSVDLRELLARVRSVLRRRALTADAAAGRAQPRFGRMRLDLARRRLVDADGAEVPLSSTEFDLLRVFAHHPNRVLSREQILDLAGHGDAEPFDRSIDVRINRMRRKIESDPAKPQILKTVRNAGYVFVPAAGA